MATINIITPYDNMNYGAMLQAYALQNVLQSINDGDVGIYEYEPIVSNSKKSLKAHVASLGRSLNKKALEKGDKRFLSFRAEYFNMNKETDRDVYIAGSDQIWNPNNFIGYFYCSFVNNPDSVKASYAASMGVSTVSEEKLKRVREAVAKLDFISVRENTAIELLGSELSTRINVNIDPTFLLKEENWRVLENTAENYGSDYILVYILHIPDGIRNYIQELKKKTGKKVVLIDRSGILKYQIKADKVVSDAGPREFLTLFRNAGYVVTSSFHGTAFSVIYKKPFTTLINPLTPSRVQQLLNTLGIEIDSSGKAAPCWEEVEKRLCEEKKKSITYLSRIIEKGGCSNG